MARKKHKPTHSDRRGRSRTRVNHSGQARRNPAPENAQSFTTPEVASYLRVSESWLRQRRMAGTLDGQQSGPPYVRIGRAVRYVKAHVDEWLARCSRS